MTTSGSDCLPALPDTIGLPDVYAAGKNVGQDFSSLFVDPGLHFEHGRRALESLGLCQSL